MSTSSPITIRPATARDESALRRLAALDCAPQPSGDVVVAEAGGSLIAAIGGRRPIADPFRPTADVLAALRAFAA